MKIYLAGPDVFRQDAKEYGTLLKKTCSAFGAEGLFPLDNELEVIQNEAPWEFAKRIYNGNIEMIKSCDVVIANVQRFRGPSADAGTVFEIGYANALGKPVYGYTTDTREYVTAVGDLGSKCFDLMNVEDFKLFDNLMIVYGIKSVHKTFLEALEKAVSEQL